MKGLVLGMVGLGGVGTAGYFGLGESGPNDFIQTSAKSPAAFYAAFGGLGQAGEKVLPSHDGKRIVQRVTKIPNELVKLELLVDSAPVVSAEVRLSAEGTGTRVAAEIDVDTAAINAAMVEDGFGPIPQFALQDYLLDQVFARAMGEMVERVEEGKPLLSLTATRARWNHGGERPRGGLNEPSPVRAQAARPQLDARPTLDPNAAAQRHLAGGRPAN